MPNQIHRLSILQDAIDELHFQGQSHRWDEENKTEQWQSSAGPLVSRSNILDFSIGTGRTLFASTLLPAILSAREEVILATCFWAKSETLEQLTQTLKSLSERIVSNKENRVKVYICLSSRSLLQKLFHTSSPKGHIYAREAWTRQLGLPSASEIPGLELRVQSLFFRPFSVLHSKYLIIDRRDVWLPSCNVSWEEWYECSIHLRGPVVRQVFDFWKGIWDIENRVRGDTALSRSSAPIQADSIPALGLHPLRHIPFHMNSLLTTTILPHKHHSALRYNIWLPPLHRVRPPSTPLNTALQHLFARAKHSITLLTPNFTSAPIFNAILAAIERGVNVRLVTNRRMMIVEQLITSGSITEWWIWKLRRAYRKLVQRQSNILRSADIEGSTSPAVGVLSIEYFRPILSSTGATSTSQMIGNGDAEQGRGIARAAAKTHIKLTVVDEEIIVLGSGNMDRASWYTSQELGIMLEGREEVRRIWSQVEAGLEGCLDRYC